MRNAIMEHACNIVDEMSENRPLIYLVLGAAGLLSAGVIAGMKTPKVKKELETINEECQEESTAMVVAEKAKVVAKEYILPTTLVVTSVILLSKSYSEQTKKFAAMASAYQITSDYYKEYREHVKNKLGEKKEKEVRDEIAEEKVKKNPPKADEALPAFGPDGRVRCRDDWGGGGYFRSTEAEILRVTNEINERLFYEEWIPMNDFRYELGLTATTAGDILGFNLGNKCDPVISYTSIDGELILNVDFPDTTTREAYTFQ